jgi:hypothetical protein
MSTLPTVPTHWGSLFLRLFVPERALLSAKMPGVGRQRLIGKTRVNAGERVPIVAANSDALRGDRRAVLGPGQTLTPTPCSSRDLRAMVMQFLPLAQTGALTAAVPGRAVGSNAGRQVTDIDG